MADWSVVDNAVRKIISDVLKDMMVLPQKMLVKLDPEASLMEVHQEPLGVCRLMPVRAQGFKVQNKKSYLRVKDVPDVYLKISFGANPPWRTKVCMQRSFTLRPVLVCACVPVCVALI